MKKVFGVILAYRQTAVNLFGVCDAKWGVQRRCPQRKKLPGRFSLCLYSTGTKVRYTGLLSVFSCFFSEKQANAGLRVQRKAGFGAVLVQVRQDGAAFWQQFQRPGSVQLFKLRGIAGHAVGAQTAVQTAADHAAAQLGTECFPFADGQIDRAGGRFDQLEFRGHLRKRELTAGNAVAERIQNAFFVQCLGTPCKVKLLKISADGIRGVELRIVIFMAAGGILQGVHMLVQHLRHRAAFQPEAVHLALCRAAAAFAVAAPGGLQQRVQPALFPVGGGEVYVHTGLDQGGGHHPAGQAVRQPLPDFFQLAAAVCGAQQGGQAETAFFGQGSIQFLRRLAAVHHAQHLRQGGQLRRKFFLRQRANVPDGRAAEGLIERFRVRADLLHPQFRGKFLEKGFQRRLGGSAQHSGGVVMLHQLGNGADAGLEVVQRQSLCLVKNDHAVSDVVQLAAAAAAVGIERLKKLHGGGDDDRRIPVFAGQQLAVLGGCQVFGVGGLVFGAGVIRKDVFLPQKLCEVCSGLVDDGHIRDDVDHPLHALRGGVLQREGQRCKGLAAAGGHSEGVEPLRPVGPFVQTGLQHGVALAADRGGALRAEIALCLCPGLFQQGGDALAAAAGRGPAVHEGLGIKKICVYQAGVEHPGEEGKIQQVAVGPGGRGALRQGHFLPAAVRLHGLFQAAEQGAVLRVRIPLIAAVRQAGVMARNGKGRLRVRRAAFHGFLRPGGGVVHPGAVFQQPFLEGSAVFADVMQPAGEAGFLRCAEGCGKLSGQVSCAGKVFIDGLCAGFILADVGKCRI